METDPNGKSAHEPGSKLDEGKPSLHRGVICYFPRALERVAEVSAFGANKYTWGGWRSVPDGCTRYKDAAIRHSVKEEYEGLYDKDSNLLHAAHFAWNALASLELLLNEVEETGRREEDQPLEEEAKDRTCFGKEPHGGDTLFWGIRTEGC